MKILLLGSGGRENALGWKMYHDNTHVELFFMGNTHNYGLMKIGAKYLQGNIESAQCVIACAQKYDINLVCIGPEMPLYKNIAQKIRNAHILCFGPDKIGAQLETSKIFTKKMCTECDIPTAQYRTFSSSEDARQYINHIHHDIYVIKKDCLSQGKGVYICTGNMDAINTLKKIHIENDPIIIEEYLAGYEISCFVLYDGKSYKHFSYSRDYKRAMDNNKGYNTGGMGAFALVSVPEVLHNKIYQRIVHKTITYLQEKSIDYKGLLYFGIMVCKNDPYLLEINVRFGDPETQALMPIMKSDIIPYFVATAQGNLDTLPDIQWKSKHSVNVVISDTQYPHTSYEEAVCKISMNNIQEDEHIFFSSAYEKEKDIFYGKGRMLSLTVQSESLSLAREKAYSCIKNNVTGNVHYRSDIALNTD